MRVLLVEDDVSTKKNIELMLGSLGYDFDSVEMGEDGLELARRGEYDIILLDIMLPGMDGYDVIGKLREARIETPVLLQSGLIDRDAAVQGLSLGVDDYLIKPYSKVELAVRIESALNRACLRTLTTPVQEAPPEAEPKVKAPGPGPAPVQERRADTRRNVLRSAEISGADSDQVMDCVLLNLSDTGGALKPADPPHCPSRFSLKISNGLSYDCEVCWRYRDKVGVRFLET